jgi:hypothetical protein
MKKSKVNFFENQLEIEFNIKADVESIFIRPID